MRNIKIQRIIALQEAIDSLNKFIAERVFTREEINLFDNLQDRKNYFMSRRNEMIKDFDPAWYDQLIEQAKIKQVSLFEKETNV